MNGLPTTARNGRVTIRGGGGGLLTAEKEINGNPKYYLVFFGCSSTPLLYVYWNETV